MKLEEKIIKLKNGAEVTLKSPDVTDAKCMTEYMRVMYSESSFMNLTVSEAEKMREEKASNFIEECLNSPDEIMISAYCNNKIVANCNVYRIDKKKKLRHRAKLGISVLKEYWGLGLGSVLMDEMIDFAKNIGCEQIELETVSTNERAIALYKKFGFEQTGIIPHAQKLESGEYQDFIIMVKVLK